MLASIDGHSVCSDSKRLTATLEDLHQTRFEGSLKLSSSHTHHISAALLESQGPPPDRSSAGRKKSAAYCEVPIVPTTHRHVTAAGEGNTQERRLFLSRPPPSQLSFPLSPSSPAFGSPLLPVHRSPQNKAIAEVVHGAVG